MKKFYERFLFLTVLVVVLYFLERSIRIGLCLQSVNVITTETRLGDYSFSFGFGYGSILMMWIGGMNCILPEIQA